jgi:uncharacterized protein (TIGR01777 family)
VRILVTGASGLVGSALVRCLEAEGHTITCLVRRPPRPGGSQVLWNPELGSLDAALVEAADALVHLAGESIAAGRWTRARKAGIRDSRVKVTRRLCESLATFSRPPRVVVCASAIGYYGDRSDEVLTEESPPGSGFLAEVCREWEAACELAVRRGIRVVNLRTGMVLSAAGGVLPRMLLPFRMGLGGRIGSGRQYMSWIALEDLVGVIVHALTCDRLAGPVNAVAPNPVTNHEFTRTLGRVLHRPTFLAVPAWAARLAFGEMADTLLLASGRVVPARLAASGFVFRYAELESALRHVLGR